ncbi:MAG: hypothetical protein ACRDSZ_12885 [Pseudonocardiaceae bacterium]
MSATPGPPYQLSSAWRTTGTVAPDARTVRSLDTGHALVFDETEWTAFRLGATVGEFDPPPSQN